MVKMKDSGIEWIGEIPETWEKVKFNAIYSNRNTKVSDREYAPLSVTKKGIVPQLATAAKTNDNDNRKLVKSGDFVINSRSDRRGSCGISSLDGSVSLINTVLEPKNSQMEPLYFDFLFHTIQFADEFYKWGHGIVDDLWTTNWNDMKNITLILPTRSEQQLIADFLDHKTVEIDGLIDKINTEIDTLKQYQSSVITQAVTKGLDPNVPMKDSGIEWVGEIPETWEVAPLYKYFSERKNKNCTGNEKNLLSLSYGRIIRKNIESKGGLLPESFTTYNIIEPGDIIIRPTDLQNDTRSLRTGLSNEHGIITSAYIDLAPESETNSRYYHYLLHSYDIQKVFYNMGNGVRQGLNYSEFSKLRVPIPEQIEQGQIANYLDQKVAKIQKVIKSKQQQINQLTEYKNSLIFEYVTGKKQVKEAN